MPLTNTSTGELVTAAWLNAIVDRVNAFLVNATGGIWTGTVQKVAQSFRGLKLRTHYNALAAPSQVAVMSLDEVVMSDGVRYLPPSTIFPLHADVTVSGPGGLDTGTEAASTWYEIYLIGKSSTGATSDLRAMLHKAKTYTADAAFTSANDASRALRRATSTATDKLAQGLQFGATGNITFVDVPLSRAGAVVGTVWFTLQTSSGTDATGTVLATTMKIDAATISTSVQLIRLPFTSSPSVTNATQYHLVMEGDYSRSDTVNISMHGVAAGGYASGAAREYNGGAWAPAVGFGDFTFRAYLKRNDTALTYPVGYDQSCKIGYVYNNSSSNFAPFYALGYDVRRLHAGAGVPNDWAAGVTSLVPQLIDMSTLLPPCPVIFRNIASGASAGMGVILGGVPDGFGTIVNAGDYGQSFGSAPVANYAFDMPDVYTDYQGAYVYGSGFTAAIHAWLLAWRWSS